MLPGVGICGSDPISKILIQLLEYLQFEVHGIWTNNYEIEEAEDKKSDTSRFSQYVTTSIDNVLLNKNINLLFVCCQPSFHSNIVTKALGIGKNVVCLLPTCKNIDEIVGMINSARYYPSLMSSISYGGYKYLSEFKLIKESLPLIGEIKCCNININCQNIAAFRQNKSFQPQDSLSNVIDSIASNNTLTHSSCTNWLLDRDLGAGVLNRFGAVIISFIINLFEQQKVTQVFGSLHTFIENIGDDDRQISKIRKITADDHCTFQLCLEPLSLVVYVSINSLAQCKYSQEVIISGSEGTIVWNSSKVVLRSNTNTNILNKSQPNKSNRDFFETDLIAKEIIDEETEKFLETFKHVELNHPELPLVVIKGIFYYLKNVKEEFENKNLDKINNNTTIAKNLNDSISIPPATFECSNIESFEHIHIVQSIIKSISLSSEKNRWVTVNY